MTDASPTARRRHFLLAAFCFSSSAAAGCGASDAAAASNATNATAGGAQAGSAASGTGGAAGAQGGASAGVGGASAGGKGGAQTSGGSGGGGTGGASGGMASCGDPEAMIPGWMSGFVPTTEIYVSPAGDDAHDGKSPTQPLKSTKAAFAKLAPGVRVNFKTGTYDCQGAYAQALVGTPSAPVVLRSLDGPRTAKFDCGGQGGFLFDRVSFVAVDGIELSSIGMGHGLQVSSGSPFDPAMLSHDIVVAHSFIHHTALANIKASQAKTFHVIGNELAFASKMRQMVEFVAVDQVIIAGNDGHDAGAFDEIKGGSKDSMIYRNHVHDTGGGILVGGDCTGYQFLIDEAADYEAKNLRVWDNLIVNASSEAFRVVGCKDCVIANNTFYSATSTTAAIRFLSEGFGNPTTGTCDFKPAPSVNVVVENNVFSSPNGWGYMIPASQPTGLTLSHNAWWMGTGDVTKVGSDVPFTGDPTSFYVDPALAAPPADLTPLPGSPLVGNGIAVAFVTGNAKGVCSSGKPNIGAL